MAPRASDWQSRGRGWKSPGESTRAQGGGKVPSLCWAPGPRGSHATRVAPPGPKGNKNHWSHLVTFPFLPEQSHAPKPGLEETNYSGKLRQGARCASSVRRPSPGAPPLVLVGRRCAAPFAPTQPESGRRGAMPLMHIPQASGPRARHPASQSPAESARIPPSPRRQLPAAGEGGELSLGVRGRGSGGRLQSRRGLTGTTPSVQQEPGRRVRAPVRPRPLAGPTSSDPATSGDRGPPFLPPARHTCSPG